ncbi:succinate dehydrogenase/fumarate reductase flavoprotein subunit [Streptomyces sp. 2333.5]|uniref:fumarate reductase/succinate dehydrogenase flavoprotein subunit n=1 Tax=unclassified Streptomyces TaxID=2593676 RepID=UPI000898D50D|nr:MULTISPECIES: fumarate reductase/succinate dehydrogenase flavoprotein subunit [unclassified Streptomyces]PJJ06290.1 succinate dehydrogenase/fumarate reductase flavoprotein subunit [Streptomyces sp. 2333.5]SEE93385.1 Succinate dehydrogenase/fumarate reductase, flavoprotein subunit [Streptomyces sp. 2314.4]SEF08611.1 Succinate dehydrogenase/fumarate reductase, flavoprotein subunit [Streptomyces sp. 2112.2]
METTEVMEIPSPDTAEELSCDVLVIGGGTAGTMAALTAAEHGASVLLLEKAHVRHSGALAMGMDGVNNAVIPGRAEPDDYVAEITRANDGIVDQSTVRRTATRGFAMVQRLESYGVKFEKDEHGAYAVRRVHRSGSYVLPMPEGKDVKKVLYRQLRRREMRERIRIENRIMPVRVLTSGGRAVGAAGFHTRTGRFVTVRAGAVILATGACGRLGLPASGYLYGTYENPTNAGDGYAMAYHAGAELTGIECFQINPLIKDYNGPACAYVANPFGGYQVNRHGARFVESDYWSGQMMAEFAAEVASARGPVYLKLSHLPEESVAALETILHTTERPTRGTFHAGRGHDYRTHDVEMHISEIGLCGGHSASGVRVDDRARTTVPGLYAAGDLACVPHNYMIGAFVFGDLAGEEAAQFRVYEGELPADQVRAAHELIYRPLRSPDGPPQPQVEYKLRRFVNDYVAPPKSGARLSLAVEHFTRMHTDIAAMGARTPHELMRCAEVTFIRDCAEMAARSSLARTESRWGLYHARTDHPKSNDRDWLHHLDLRKSATGAMEFTARPVAPYLVPVDEYAPMGGASRFLGEVHPEQVATAGRRDTPPVGSTGASAAAAPGSSDGTGTATGTPPSPRILELLALTEDQPDLPALRPYLADPDPAVRRAAVDALTESVPPGTGQALAAALADPAPAVRAAAGASLRELVEVLPPEAGLGASLAAAVHGPDAVVRSAAVEVLRALGLGDRALFAAALTDPAVDVRLQAVRALVSVDAPHDLRRAAEDGSREVRVAAAQGLGTVGRPEELAAFLPDDDPLVRAAALAALATAGCPAPYDAAAATALGDPAWQVRAGAATALTAAGSATAVAALSAALGDPHADVRKAAVLALRAHAGRADARRALSSVADDPDADVRAYARPAATG